MRGNRYTRYIPPVNDRLLALKMCCLTVLSIYLLTRLSGDRSMITLVFLNETLRSAQDHDMAIRLAEHGKIGYINEVLWKYRRHGGSISRNRTLERWQNGFRILRSACTRYPYPMKTRLSRRAVLHFRLSQCHKSTGNHFPRNIPFTLLRTS